MTVMTAALPMPSIIPADSPASQLYTAYSAHTTHEVTANELIKKCIFNNTIIPAVNQLLELTLQHCIDNIEQQKYNLQCCSYALLYLYNTDTISPHNLNFVLHDKMQVLRALNVFRRQNIAIDYSTYNKHGIRGVIKLLIDQHHFATALQLCEYMELSNNVVLVEWCKLKLQAVYGSGGSTTQLTELQVSDLLISKLKLSNDTVTLDVRPICNIALEHSKLVLYDVLLNYSTNVQHQVMLLLQVRNYDAAMQRAVSSHNASHILCVMFVVQDTKNDKLLLDLLRTYQKDVLGLWVAYLQSCENYEEIKLVYYSLQRNVLAGNVQSEQAMRMLDKENVTVSDVEQAVANLSLANEMYKKNDKVNFYTESTEQQMLLLQILMQQNKVKGNAGDDVRYEMSVFDLYKHFVRWSQGDKAAQLVKMYGISEHIQTLLRINVYISQKMFIQLDLMFNSNRRVYINAYLNDIIDQLIEQKQSGEALKYIQYLTEYHEQMEYLCAINYWVQAAQIAVNNDDYNALLLIRQKCKQLYPQKQIDQLIEKYQQTHSGR